MLTDLGSPEVLYSNTRSTLDGPKLMILMVLFRLCAATLISILATGATLDSRIK